MHENNHKKKPNKEHEEEDVEDRDKTKKKGKDKADPAHDTSSARAIVLGAPKGLGVVALDVGALGAGCMRRCVVMPDGTGLTRVTTGRFMTEQAGALLVLGWVRVVGAFAARLTRAEP